MMRPPDLAWLPPAEPVAEMLAASREAGSDARLAAFRRLAGGDLDFLACAKLDRAFAAWRAEAAEPALPRLRLAVLATHTVDHLFPALRVAALRRGLVLDVRAAPYGQLRQSLTDPALASFAPDSVLVLRDTDAAVPPLPPSAGPTAAQAAVAAAVAEDAALWRGIRDSLGALPIAATVIERAPPLFGHGDATVPGAPAALLRRYNEALRDAAAGERVPVADLAGAVGRVGLDRVHDPRLWHHAKQEVHPAAAPWWGDQVARVLAALRGLSRKVLVLDLDNTLWGGVIGDDGMAGIRIGQGSAEGEAHAAFQRHCRALRDRGVLLAVSSKNDRATAEAVFDAHPDMVLRRADIAAFEADWNDKPAALRRIAADLGLGLNALVFFDDNPSERDLVRRTLPEVAVPEVPDDPALFAARLADAGLFESVAFTEEDASRSDLYAANVERKAAEATATDLTAFLRDLDMRLSVRPVEAATVPRVAQLLNKTNQFNLTTRRTTEAAVSALAADQSRVTLCARLADRFGDNGLVSVLIARPAGGDTLAVEDWVMSCRVLGRRLEDALAALLAEEAARRGARALAGLHVPTPRNGLVADLYPRLGFAPASARPDDPPGATRWVLPLDRRRADDALALFRLEVDA
jgi:FkbH-like protein